MKEKEEEGPGIISRQEAQRRQGHWEGGETQTRGKEAGARTS